MKFEKFVYFFKKILLNSHSQCLKNKATDSSIIKEWVSLIKTTSNHKFKVSPPGSDSHNKIIAVSFLCRLFHETIPGCNFPTSEASNDKNQLSTFQMCKVPGLNIAGGNKYLGKNMEDDKKEGGRFHLASEFQQVKKKVLVQFCYFSRVWIVFYQTVGCNSLVGHEINFVGRD